jgi:transposase InsO family protein
MLKPFWRRLNTVLAALLALVIMGAVASQPASASSPYNLRAVYDLPSSTKWCMDVRDVSYLNGALIQMYQCLGPNQTNQRWYLFYVPGSGTPGVYQIVAAHSGKCLDVKDYSMSDAAELQQWECLGYNQTNQLWRRVDNGSAYVHWVSVYSGLEVGDGLTWPWNGALVRQESGGDYWATAEA